MNKKLAKLLKAIAPLLDTARRITADAIAILFTVDAVLVRETQRLEEVVQAIEKD